MNKKLKTRRFDVSCRILFVADIDETFLAHGNGFVAHVLEQEALRILKEGKRDKDFHLTVINANEMPQKRETLEETDEVQS